MGNHHISIWSGWSISSRRYIVPERKLDRFFKFKEGEDFNRRNTFAYFED